MLVLTRKVDEIVKIGEDIIVRVVRIDNNAVRLGVEAPAGVRVVRGGLKKEEDKP